MNITKETKLTRRANIFMDFPKGGYMQSYSISVEGEEAGITQLVEAKTRNSKRLVSFTTEIESFDNLDDALRSLGHEVDEDYMTGRPRQ